MNRCLATVLLLWPTTTVLGQGSPQTGVERTTARLASHAGVFHEWVTERLGLSEEQQTEIVELVNHERQVVPEYEDGERRLRVVRPLPSSAPVMFTLRTNTENFLNPTWLDSHIPEFLTVKQRAAWSEAIMERQEAIRTANLNYVVSVLDDLVLLNDERRESITQAIRSAVHEDRRKLNSLDTGLFRFPSEMSKFPVAQLYIFLSGPPRDLLSSGQKLILDSHSTRFSRTGGRAVVALPLPIDEDGEKELRRLIRDSNDKLRTEFAQSVENRIGVLDEGLVLSDSQKRHLTIAGRGATERCLKLWQDGTVDSLQKLAEDIGRNIRAGGNPLLSQMKMNIQQPSTRMLDRDQLWQNTVTKMTLSEKAQLKRPHRRKAIVGYVTAMLDKELWLTPEQRIPLSEAVDASFPPVIRVENPAAKELELLVIPLFGIPNDKLATVLSESQRTAWRVIQNQFERRDDRVKLSLNDGSVLLFQLPP